MASGPLTSWQIEGKMVEAVTDILLGSKISADGDCSHEIRRWLLGRKAMTNLDSVLKSKDISLPTKIHTVKAVVFPGLMYGCESWTKKKAEHQRIDPFNTLSKFVTTFLPRSNRLLISWLQSPSAVILVPKRGNLSLLRLYLKRKLIF